MTNFNELSKKPPRFLSLTGYTVEEFLALLPHFTLKYQEHLEKFTFEGKPRQNRKYVEYKNAGLPTMANKLLFILIYLKGNELQESLAERFGMSQPKANRWIHLLHEVLNQTLNQLSMLPARDGESLESKLSPNFSPTMTDTNDAGASSSDTIASRSTSEAGASNLDDTTVAEPEELIDIELYLHDGTERPINRPLDKVLQRMFYSGKQKRHTVKNLLLTDISGYIWFLSETYEGKKHDKKAADEAGYCLPDGCYLGQDTGFQGFSIPGVHIVQPKKQPRGGELTEEEKEQNRTISSVRIRVEHAIGSVKRYRILKDKLRNWKKRFNDLVMETGCGLHNFRLKFRPWYYETAVI